MTFNLFEIEHKIRDAAYYMELLGPDDPDYYWYRDLLISLQDERDQVAQSNYDN